MKKHHTHKKQKIFTLAELLVGLAVLGIISVIIFSAMSNSKKRMEATKFQAQAESEMQHAIKSLRADLKAARYMPPAPTLRITPADAAENTLVTRLEFIKKTPTGDKTITYELSPCKEYLGKTLYKLTRDVVSSSGNEQYTLSENIAATYDKNGTPVAGFNIRRPAGSVRGKVIGQVFITVPNRLGYAEYKKDSDPPWRKPFMQSYLEFFEAIDSEL